MLIISDQFWRIDSVIASHVWDEAALFLPSYVTNTSGFDQLLSSFFTVNSPSQTAVRACIKQRYLPNPNGNQRTAASGVIRDSMFTCNVRYLYDALQRSQRNVWTMSYQFLSSQNAALHASDLVPTFWNDYTNVTAFAERLLCLCQSGGSSSCPYLWEIELALDAISDEIRKPYQKYLMSYATTGQPNWSNSPGNWIVPSPVGDNLANVMGVGFSAVPSWAFYNTTDDQVQRSTCNFWRTMAGAVTSGTVPSCTSRELEPLFVQDGNLHGKVEL
jgi:hypothetical protein